MRAGEGRWHRGGGGGVKSCYLHAAAIHEYARISHNPSIPTMLLGIEVSMRAVAEYSERQLMYRNDSIAAFAGMTLAKIEGLMDEAPK